MTNRRVIDAFDEPVRTVAVSPDGRFLAAAGGNHLAVWNWVTGTEAFWVSGISIGEDGVGQLAFTTDGSWLAVAARYSVIRFAPASGDQVGIPSGRCAGGIAVSPDGKTLVATRAGDQHNVTLERWELPAWRAASGFDFWSPFERLAFSPNGEYIAGINRAAFELRFANSGGLNGRQEPAGDWQRGRGWRVQRERPDSAFFSFVRHGEVVVFGWDAEFRVMETQTGHVQRRVVSPDAAFLDAVSLGSGRQLATVDGTPILRVWSADTWEVMRGYDWNAGGLTCVTATADGLAGVCGTDTGKVVVFDVDE